MKNLVCSFPVGFIVIVSLSGSLGGGNVPRLFPRGDSSSEVAALLRDAADFPGPREASEEAALCCWSETAV